jgi:hypothetical protein
MSENNKKDPNNFLLGVNVTQNNKNKPSNVLLKHLKNLEKSNGEFIKKNNSSNMKFSDQVNGLINKIEDRVSTLNEQIELFNKEKKQIIDLDTKEIDKLKEIIRTLYILVITIDKSIELKKNNSINLLEKLRRALTDSPGLLDCIDDIMMKKKNIVKTNTNSSKKINILNNFNKLSTKSFDNDKPEEKKNNNTKKLNSFYNNIKNEININKGQQYVTPNVNNEAVKQPNVNNEVVKPTIVNTSNMPISDKINIASSNPNNAKKKLNNYFL